AFRLALSRPPDAAEVTICSQLLARQAAAFRRAGRPPSEADHLALVQLCHTLLNTSEFHAAAAMLAESERTGHEPVVITAGLKALDLARVLLAVALLQLGFGIEQVHLTGTTHLQQHDDGSSRPGEVTGPRPRVRSTRFR